MPHVNPDLPEDGENADAGDITIPFQTLLAIFNGHIAADNIEPGSLTWAVMASLSDDIPAEAMEDEANLAKFRDEMNISVVASGLLWTTLSGLNATMSAGVVYTADGSRTSVSAVATRAFTASKDTYVDVSPTGSLSYAEVANGAAAPALTSDYVRLAKVVTDGSSVTGITTSGFDSLNNYIRPTGFVGPSLRRGGHKVGTFTLSATGDFAVTGLGFKPKSIEFWFLPTSASRGVHCMGATDGVNQFASAQAVSAAPNANGAVSTSLCLLVKSATNSNYINAAIKSMDTDGFTLNVSAYDGTYGSLFGYRAVA